MGTRRGSGEPCHRAITLHRLEDGALQDETLEASPGGKPWRQALEASPGGKPTIRALAKSKGMLRKELCHA